MVKDLIVVGSGGVDIIKLIEDINSEKKIYNFLGFLEKDESKIGLDIYGYPIIGNDDLLFDKLSHCAVINNVMHTTRIHEKTTNKLIEHYHISDFPNLIHPEIDLRGVEIGIGNIIYKDCRFSIGDKIGDFNIMYSATVGHESIIGNYNLLAKTSVCSRVKIGSYNLIGNSTTLANTVRLGDDNEVGVGSVVMKNYKNGYHLLGYPAIEIEDFVKKYMRKNLNKKI